MPIFDQGYQHWEGQLSGFAWRWLAITRQGVRAHWSKRWTKYLVVSAWTPALALVGFLAIWGLFEQQSTLIQPFMPLLKAILPPVIQEGPLPFRSSVWTLAFHIFFTIEIALSMLLVLLIGPDLISQDLRFNAIPLYFARPIRRLDYFLGKLGVIVTYLGAVTVLPALVAYLVGLACSLDPWVLRDTWRILFGGVAFGLIAAVCSGLIMLAFSSLSKNSRFVSLMWVGFWILGNSVAGVLVETVHQNDDERTWSIVSYTSNLRRLQEVLLDTESARDQFHEAIQQFWQTMPQQPMAGPGFGPYRRPEPFNWMVSPFPWPYAAAVLLGLTLLSVVILATRIKSMDRLR